MKKPETWNDLILRSHFQSLNPAWQEKEPVIKLLSELGEKLARNDEFSEAERLSFIRRIERVVHTSVPFTPPHPMKSAGSKKIDHKDTKTGT